MALTYTPAAQRESLPEFTLKTVEGLSWSSDSIRKADAKLFVFICNHCPYVKAIESRLIDLGYWLKTKNVPMVAICSNDPTEYPEDRPDELLKSYREKKYSFTYLVDETQQVARAFGAVCTPDFFLYDKHNHLVYRGRLDDSWKDANKVTRHELREAVEAILKGVQSIPSQSPSMGCSIKWREA
jgi:hypothetical protein